LFKAFEDKRKIG